MNLIKFTKEIINKVINSKQNSLKAKDIFIKVSEQLLEKLKKKFIL